MNSFIQQLYRHFLVRRLEFKVDGELLLCKYPCSGYFLWVVAYEMPSYMFIKRHCIVRADD
jgi:hypothetical protein